MEAYSNAVFDAAHELGIGAARWSREVAGAGLTVDGEHASERELQPAPITPRSDRIGEGGRLGAALESEASE